MKIQKGAQAPQLELLNTDLEHVKIPAEKSATVLLFFPMAFTSVCITELCSVRDNLKNYEDLNANVYGISVDSPFTLKEFKGSQNLNFPLLSDFNKTASKAYDAYYEDFVLGLKGVSKRSAFVIDKAGVVQYAEVLDDAGQLPNFDAIQNALKGL
ncbi:MAG: peroxiredoxin [Saprospirales bacterium]|nr:MAG: peroxiredoxin [Saprospirales bacterium]